jgi:hypothetical protein
MYHDSIGTRMRGGFILSLLEKLLKLDMIKWLHFLSQLDLLPVIFGTDWRYIFLQVRTHSSLATTHVMAMLTRTPCLYHACVYISCAFL